MHTVDSRFRAHCSKSSFLVQIFNFDFPRKLSIFWGWKTRENVVVLGFLAVDNFDFTRKIVKKKFGWKCWGVVKIEFFDKNLTFRIVCSPKDSYKSESGKPPEKEMIKIERDFCLDKKSNNTTFCLLALMLLMLIKITLWQNSIFCHKNSV